MLNAVLNILNWCFSFETGYNTAKEIHITSSRNERLIGNPYGLEMKNQTIVSLTWLILPETMESCIMVQLSGVEKLWLNEGKSLTGFKIKLI